MSRLLAVIRRLFLEPDDLAKARRELEDGRVSTTAIRRGPRPQLAYPDRLVDVNPVFRDALFDGLQGYVAAEQARRTEEEEVRQQDWKDYMDMWRGVRSTRWGVSRDQE